MASYKSSIIFSNFGVFNIIQCHENLSISSSNEIWSTQKNNIILESFGEKFIYFLTDSSTLSTANSKISVYVCVCVFNKPWRNTRHKYKSTIESSTEILNYKSWEMKKETYEYKNISTDIGATIDQQLQKINTRAIKKKPIISLQTVHFT